MARATVTSRANFRFVSALTLVLMLLEDLTQADDQPLDTVNVSVLPDRLRDLSAREGCELFCEGIGDMISGKSKLDFEALTSAANDLNEHDPQLGAHSTSCINLLKKNSSLLVELELENMASKDRVEKLTATIASIMIEKEELVEENRLKRGEVDELNAEIQTIESKKENLGTEISSCKVEIDRLSEESVPLSELEALVDDNTELKKKLNESKDQIEHESTVYQYRREAIEVALEKAKNSNREWVSKKYDLNKPVDELENRIADLEAELQSYEAMKKDLQKQIADIT